jgi:Ca2+-binding EF-hand superfamily protein
MLKAFQMFDTGKTGFIDTSKIATILNTLGHNFVDEELQALIEGHDQESMLN